MIARLSLLVVFWAALPVQAAPKIAVLEAIGPAGTPAAQLMSWTDAVRGAVLDGAPSGHVVLTRSNIEAFLPPGLDLADCEGECEITTARKIGAEFVVGIRVAVDGERRGITIGLHAAIDGRLMGQGRARVPAAHMERGLRDAAEQALAVWRPAPVTVDAGAGAILDLPVSPYKWLGAAVVRVESKETVSISVDGRAIGHTPLNVLLDGRAEIILHASAPGYRATRFRVRTGGVSGRVKLALPSAQTAVTLALPFDDIEVYIDDARLVLGRRFVLNAGVHRLRIAHRCLAATAFDVHIKTGPTQRVEVPIESRCSNIRIESSVIGAQVRWAHRWRSLPFETPPTRTASPPEHVTFEVRARGHKTRTVTVERPAAGTHREVVALEPDWVNLEISLTRWNGDPCDQPIRLNGKSVGQSPWRGRVRTGEHAVTGGCEYPVSARIRARGTNRRVALTERGDLGEVALRLTGLDATFVAVRGWLGPHRAGRPRFGGGIFLGAAKNGLGWGAGLGAELGFAFPITDWFEVATFGGVAILNSECPPGSERGTCGIDVFDARAVARVYWRAMLLEAGWSNVWREVPGSTRASTNHPFLGVGLSF